MTLSQSEARILRRFRKFERNWPWCRWLSLAICIPNLAFWGLLLHIQTSAGAKTPDEAVSASSDVALCTVLVFVFGAFAVHTLSHWRGDPKISLLLKLYDSHENEAAQQGTPPNRR